MPGPTTISTDDRRERMLSLADLHTFLEAGLVVHLRDIRLVEEHRTDHYMLVWVRNHGFAAISKQTEQGYLLTDYGFLCLALGAGVDRQLDLILTPEGEVARG